MVDVLIGWKLEIGISESLEECTSQTLLSLGPLWERNVPFARELIFKLATDMSKYVFNYDPRNHGIPYLDCIGVIITGIKQSFIPFKDEVLPSILRDIQILQDKCKDSLLVKKGDSNLFSSFFKGSLTFQMH